MIFLQATTTAATATPLSVILSAMLMPLIFLLVFSTIKNFVAVGIDKIDYFDFFAEMAIDLLSIFSSFVIGRFLIETNTQTGLINAFKIISVMAAGAIVLCMVRRKVMAMRSESDVNMKTVGWIVALEYLIDVICLALIAIFL